MDKLSTFCDVFRMEKVDGITPLDLEAVGKRLDAVRAASGLIAKDFANSVGIDPSSYSKIVQGKKPLKIEMGHNVSIRWGAKLEFLYHGDLSELPEKHAKTIIAHLQGRKA